MHADGTHWTMSWLENADNMAATLWEHRDRYIDNSPYLYLDRVTTPLLLIHGSQDTAVDARFSDEIFMALRRLGREVQYAKYPDEGHVILGHANAIDAAERMAQWFESHLRPHAGMSAD
jgi:dipeptidyl aminopeptidase/acylaminoacyl peptidase